jgi:hypothetical protein
MIIKFKKKSERKEFQFGHDVFCNLTIENVYSG